MFLPGIIAGHQCEGCPRGAVNFTGTTPEALCIAIGTDGNSTLRAGHDNLIPRDKRPPGDWGCIFNSGPENCKGNSCNNRICATQPGSNPPKNCFQEFRAVQKVGADPVRWILTSSGFEVPPGAVRVGGSRVVARTLTANSNDGNVIPGFADTSTGKLDALLYDDNGAAAHPKSQYNATDFEIACCGNDTVCKPKPKRPAVYHHPWVRFAHTIPAGHAVDCIVTLGNQTKVWSQYKFGRFSDWAGHFDAPPGKGKIEIYENVGGQRGSSPLATATRYLPPGPVLITIKGEWPPVSDTPTALGSIEAIANSFTKPADGEAEVRLFNLSPDTKTASMSVDGKETATDVAFTLGSDWSAMASTTHAFSVTDSGTSKVVAAFSQTPPIGASSVFLIGAQAATAPGFKTTTVFLVDNPSI
jgi:hypothetical protein